MNVAEYLVKRINRNIAEHLLLQYAIDHNNMDAAEYLVKRILNLRPEDQYESITNPALRSNDKYIQRYLDKNRLLVVDAIKRRSLDQLSTSLRMGADLRTDGNYSNINLLLYYGPKYGNKEIMEYLVNNIGIDIHAKDMEGNSIICYAASNDNIEAIEYLMSKGIDINTTNKFNQTPIFFAVNKKNPRMVEYLIKHGANVNVADKNGTPLLHFAITCGNLEVIKCLVENGADINASGPNKDSAFGCAVKCGNEKIINYLNLMKQKQRIKNIKEMAEEGKYEEAKQLMQNTTHVSMQDESGSTLLHWATLNRHLPIVKALISRNDVNINACDADNNTALHMAVASKNIEMVKCLVNGGANINVRNKNGETPYRYVCNINNNYLELRQCKQKEEQQELANEYTIDAIKTGDFYYLKFIKFMIDNGVVSINTKDEDGNSLIDIAKQSKNDKILEYLELKQKEQQTLENNKELENLLKLASEFDRRNAAQRVTL
ncbi:MAG: ankyrin repeat domain-containing protein [Rickettsiales bacterium]|nr:ankyrin repeat domain-containing protein [Rickettsiales bacterium]